MIAAEMPDLVLLDIMMPGLSGYEVCKRLRADPATALLPVVLCTSLDATAGARQRHRGRRRRFPDQADQPPELFARVKSLLRIKALQDEVKVQAAQIAQWNQTLEQRVQEQVGQIEAPGPPEALLLAAAVPRPSSRVARTCSRRTGARSAWCSSTCAASPPSPTRPNRKR
jgi:CheY-like chemotaxis protein